MDWSLLERHNPQWCQRNFKHNPARSWSQFEIHISRSLQYSYDFPQNGNVTTWLKVGETLKPTKSFYYLNGNTITSVIGSNKKALTSTQATISGDTVTLSTSYLSTLSATTLGDLGENLLVKSNKGAEIPIEIRRYGVPIVSTTNFTTPPVGSDLYIPTNFNGARLATVRALKADGIFLKDDWTV